MEHLFNIIIVLASLAIFFVTWLTMNPGQNFFLLLFWMLITSILGAIFGMIVGIPIDEKSLNFLGLITAGLQIAFFGIIMKFKFKMEFDSSYWAVLGAFTVTALVFNLVPV